MNFKEYLIESLDKRHYGRHAFFGADRNKHIMAEIQSLIHEFLEDHVTTQGVAPFDVHADGGDRGTFYDNNIDEDDDDDWDYEDEDDDADYDAEFRNQDSFKDVRHLAYEHIEARKIALVKKLFKQVTKHGERFINTAHGEFESGGVDKNRQRHQLIAYMITIQQLPYHERDAEVALPPTLVSQLVQEVEQELRNLLRDHVKDIRIGVVEGEGKRASHVSLHDHQVIRHPYKYYTMIVTFEWYHDPIHEKTKRGAVSKPKKATSFAQAIHQLASITSTPMSEFLPQLADFIENQSS